MSVQAALSTAILHLNDKTIHIKVPAQVTKDMILQEKNLMDKIRNESGLKDLIFSVEIDKSLFPDSEESKPTQIMSQKERYQYMMDKNPELITLVIKFGLKLDTEI